MPSQLSSGSAEAEVTTAVSGPRVGPRKKARRSIQTHHLCAFRDAPLLLLPSIRTTASDEKLQEQGFLELDCIGERQYKQFSTELQQWVLLPPWIPAKLRNHIGFIGESSVAVKRNTQCKRTVSQHQVEKSTDFRRLVCGCPPLVLLQSLRNR